MGKGSGFEREVCKILSLCVSHQGRDDLFWRTPGSGARATTRMKKMLDTFDAAGDMMATAKYSKPFTKAAIWEFKRGYGGTGKKKKRAPSDQVDPLSILDNPLDQKKPPVLIGWWEKLTDEKIAHGRRYAFLILKRDRKDKCIVMDDYTFQHIARRNGPIGKKYFFIFTGATQHHIVIIRLDEFLNWCHPQRTFVEGWKPTRTIRRRKIRRRTIRRRKRREN
jgi:hypothetical protein